jgi:hypothetical protein
MSYTVTYNPPKPIRGAAPKLVINEQTPTEAWALVQQINGGDVNTEGQGPFWPYHKPARASGSGRQRGHPYSDNARIRKSLDEMILINPSH